MKRHLAIAIIILLACGCACNLERPRKIAAPEKKDTKQTERKPGAKKSMPEMGAWQVFNVDVEELSGLCMNRDSTAFWAVGDEGTLCKVSFDGKVTGAMPLDMDMEGITIDPASGDLFMAIEGDQMVCRVSAPDYTRVDTLFYVNEAVQQNFENNGLEGIAFYKDSLLFVGSQEDALLWTYRFDGTAVSRISLMDETSLIEEIAGLYYDAPKKWLWVTDSDACKLFIFSAENFDLLASYDVPFIENAESICVDRARKCVWVGSDEDSPKLYRFSFTF